MLSLQERDRPTITNKEHFERKKNTDLQRKKTKITEGKSKVQDDLTGQLVVVFVAWLAVVCSTLTNKNKSGYGTKRKKRNKKAKT